MQQLTKKIYARAGIRTTDRRITKRLPYHCATAARGGKHDEEEYVKNSSNRSGDKRQREREERRCVSVALRGEKEGT